MLLEMRFRSNELKMETHVNVILPETNGCVNTPCKTLWLLHGLSGDHTSWTKNTSIERYANEHNIAVIMPGVGRSWYTNTAYEANYFDFVAKELPELCRSVFQGLNTKREDTIVAGISMGGYGALRMAMRHPESFGAAVSFSGAFDLEGVGRYLETLHVRGPHVWGPIANMPKEKWDLVVLAQQALNQGAELPKLMMSCGTEDYTLEINRKMKADLKALGIELTYEEHPGEHNWDYWETHIQRALDWLPLRRGY